MDFNKNYKISTLISEEELAKRIAEIGEEITTKFIGEKVYVICILKGSLFFTSELCKNIKLPMVIDFMQVSSYGKNTISSGFINVIKDLENSIEGENVIVIEDIVDTGNTLNKVMKLLESRKPKSLTLCTLLDKPSRRVVDISPDYVGFVVPDKFVVGFGLDFDQRFRNLPYIGVIED